MLRKVLVIITSCVILGKTTPLDFSLLTYNMIIHKIPFKSPTEAMNLHKCLALVSLFCSLGHTEKVSQNFS